MLVPILAIVVLGSPALVQARSLARQLHSFLDSAFIESNKFIEVVTPILERVAIRGVDYPVTATTPGFTYRFNFDLGVPERSESLGPVYGERADTVGRRRLDVGLSYLHAELGDFEGKDFARQIVTQGSSDSPLPFSGRFAARNFDLVSDVVSFTATYGLTDEWDMNVLQPMVRTSLHLDGIQSTELNGRPPTVIPYRRGFDADAFGPGDTLLRTKYRILDGSTGIALALGVRLPAGSDEDFRGLGDVTVTPSTIVSRTWGREEVHGSLGLELNGDDWQRDRARYTLGASLQPTPRLAFLVDVLGSSSFTNDDFDLQAPAGRVFPQQAFGSDALVESRTSQKIVAFVPRSDVVDLAVGVKVNPLGAGVGFVSVIVPLTADGLRPDVILAAGVQILF